MEHIISMTRQELQDQLDATSRLCERLTQAVKTLAEERDAARKQRDELLAAARLCDNIKNVTDEKYFYSILRRAISSVEK